MIQMGSGDSRREFQKEISSKLLRGNFRINQDLSNYIDNRQFNKKSEPDIHYIYYIYYIYY